MKLRYYQSAAIQAVYQFVQQRAGHPLIVLPTGAGKTAVIGTIVDNCVTTWGLRVLVLAHVKELLSQAERAACSINPRVPISVYSAGLNRREIAHKGVTIAGIQSVYNRAVDLGKIDVVLVDEAHLIPPEGAGMYRQLLKDLLVINPGCRVIGLTATPYRTSTGLIYGPGELFSDVAYEIGVRELIEHGFLSPLISPRGLSLDGSGVRVEGGEFRGDDVENLFLQHLNSTCSTIAALTRYRTSTLVFCPRVKHAVEVVNYLQVATHKAVDCVFGDSSATEREAAISAFQSGRIQYLVNVDCLTTGFDAPNVDCVALLRMTTSPCLFYQMVGRGLRLSPGKTDCLVLDFGGNIDRHGPIDQIEVGDRRSRNTSKSGLAPSKQCPDCECLVAAAARECLECGHIFPEPQTKFEDNPSQSSPISQGVEDIEVELLDISYHVHHKKNAEPDDPCTMRVEYHYGPGNWDHHSEWVCIEHSGWARQRAEQWWAMRSDQPCPSDVRTAVAHANRGGLAAPNRILVRKVRGQKYRSVVGWDITEPVTGMTIEPVTVEPDDDWDVPQQDAVSELIIPF